MDDKFTVQTRDEDGEIKHFESISEAIKYSAYYKVWKISFGLPTGERIRLVRWDDERFSLEQLLPLDGTVKPGTQLDADGDVIGPCRP